MLFSKVGEEGRNYTGVKFIYFVSQCNWFVVGNVNRVVFLCKSMVLPIGWDFYVFVVLLEK